MIDVLITTYNRVYFLKKTIESLLSKNRKIRFRLFIIDDNSNDETPDYLNSIKTKIPEGNIILSTQRMGVVYGFNLLWTIVEYYNQFTEDFPFMCYLQDDVESVEEEWLAVLLDKYEFYLEKENISFASGYDSPEHPITNRLNDHGYQIYLKKSTSFQNVLASKDYWRSIGLVPKYNPDGSSRGFPNNGRGSHLDLYFTGCMSGSRFAPNASANNSSYVEGKPILVIPGLLRHLGIKKEWSTWRRRDHHK